jgi:hypothetical protein
MNRWLILIALVGYGYAQNTPTIGVLPDNGPVIPATCVIGQLYFKTAATTGLNQCTATNTWTVVPTSSGSGTVTNTGGSLPSNAVVLGNTAPDIKADTKLSTDGAGAMTTTTGGTALTHTQGTITTSNPTFSHTATWNAGGVAFTNWISNITCTAAATASFAAKLGVGGTDWQFKYNASNCGTPQLLGPNGAVGNPGYSFVNGTNAGLTFNTNNSGTVVLGVAGFDAFAVKGAFGPVSRSDIPYMFSSTAAVAGSISVDTNINRGAAGVICAGVSNSAPDCTGALKAALYQTNTNCAAVGTAANPSVASCTAAIAGSFSCATNASTGTCTVNTTAVTANSEIFIEGRNDTTTGTRLGVTCNTGITTALPEISAVVAATSFTINLGTFTTNPECFSYFIVN